MPQNRLCLRALESMLIMWSWLRQNYGWEAKKGDLRAVVISIGILVVLAIVVYWVLSQLWTF